MTSKIVFCVLQVEQMKNDCVYLRSFDQIRIKKLTTDFDLSTLGSSINHVVTFLGIFDPPPPSWSLLLNKAYVIKWSFG